MPAMPPPVTDERHALHAYLAQQQYAYHALALGLADDQARATPTVSALSIGALIKHATGVQRMWMQRVAAAPSAPAADNRSAGERQAEYADEFLMGENETISSVPNCSTPRTRKPCGWWPPPTSNPRCPFRGTRPDSRRTSRHGRCAGCCST
jgi:uncharacterized damage-inducible protein DinB